MKLKYILLVVAAVACIRTAVGQCLDFDGEEATSVGVYIKNIKTGEVIVDHNSGLSLTPASVMKVITTASALSVLNPDSCFSTPVVLRGSMGPSGTWSGDLVVRAVADPTLESNSFKNNLGFADRIVRALKSKGITRITGAIEIEGSLSDAGPLAQWEIEDVVWPYGGGLFAFNYRDNSATLFPNTGKTRPEVPGLKVSVRHQDGPNRLIRGVNSSNILVYTRNTKDTRWAFDVSVTDPAEVFCDEI
ncbi:MAG: D-alanyl-D-alanine carboxypeptidase, partial [Muribaculaceae bacterium]|nr:D-alanyl-D-alanine carboxypeptidase [Muribaculaceae bacterium]